MNILIIGGAGFIGCNLAEYYASKDEHVHIIDNLCRKGASINLRYLQEKHQSIQFSHGDIRNYYDLQLIFKKHTFDYVFLLAGQVAVTTSVVNPREDFEINAHGALNVLEAMREAQSEAILMYSSTNKVYGGMETLKIVERNNRYQYENLPNGISEDILLDFHSPYGCSKGAAEQYVRDYSRIYKLKTIVFRQSCIYGYRQFGIEDQGWVAWFTIAATFGCVLNIFGDGKQVRDVLFIDDLIQAFEMALENLEVTNGKIYNIGGGPFQMSLLELLDYLEKDLGRSIPVQRGDWRPGDQKVYVSNILKAKQDFGWEPKISVEEGVHRLYLWIKANKSIFQEVGIIK